MIEELVLARHDGQGLRAQREELLAVYQEIYAERLTDPFFAPDRFWTRMRSCSWIANFRLVTGRVDGELVCFTTGSVLPADTVWWQGFQGDADPNLFRETGSRTFGIYELQVRPEWRRRGFAKALTDELLAGWPVERATLWVRADNTAARTAYLSWGFRVVGAARPADDAPLYEVMVRELPAPS